MDTFRINDFREKRADFIEAIENEIAGLNDDGSPEALDTAKVWGFLPSNTPNPWL